MLRFLTRTKACRSLTALGMAAVFVCMAATASVGPVQAADERVDRPESYYLAVLGVCYRAGAGMFGEAVVENASLSVPSYVRKEVLREWGQAVRDGADAVTAFCAHSYYSAIGKGYLHTR
jgi:hypothetical protein